MRKVKWDDLTEGQEQLLVSARMCRDRAYAPYSKYKVGAAVKDENGRIFSGCNVELVTLSRTTHAEGNAIDTMIANGGRKITALACVDNDGGAPCGECRQRIWEFCHGNPDVSIIGADIDLKNIQIFTIGELYPYSFGPEALGIDPSKY
ncbi:MAG TPA: cytidine deaminase [Candidatus Paceibacterota bacterium]|nr:cytidine deaminase [Candidatus Paceibacterota bacterium]